MANLGSIGTKILLGKGGTQGFPGINCVRVGPGERLAMGLTESLTEGNPAAPSMRLDRPHRRRFLWPVASGARTISVDVKYTVDPGVGSRPKLVIRANTDIGVNSDIVTEASSAVNSWQTIGPVSVSPSSQGVLEIELRWDSALENAQVAYWDNVVVT